jgi:hypothetical protein
MPRLCLDYYTELTCRIVPSTPAQGRSRTCDRYREKVLLLRDYRQQLSSEYVFNRQL